jgi:proprotein convertase subtilisin/kexin type 5
LPTFAYIPTLKCYNKCPDSYFNNVTDHKCYVCPAVCTTCNSPTSCNSCISNYYLQNGQCVIQCSGVYYANTTSMKCVVSTLCKPYYGVNSTNKCSSSCPIG